MRLEASKSKHCKRISVPILRRNYSLRCLEVILKKVAIGKDLTLLLNDLPAITTE